MKKILMSGLVAAASFATLSLVGCASRHEEGVKSNLLSQWTEVAADVEKSVAAAKGVLLEDGLKDVDGSNTKVDGKASGKKADGTVVHVSVSKTATGSQVSVNVGTLGDREYGAKLAKRIKDAAEK
jgi:Protein of unknown function (DUF3568)